MKLYLVQHGDAVLEQVDPSRPLSEKGRQDVGALAAFLARAKAPPARVVHSGKLRAQQTAEIIARHLPPGASVEAESGLDPKDDPAAAARRIGQSAADAIVVSHMPLLARLAALLLTGNAEPAILAFQPGTAACLERDDAGSWTLSWLVRPGLVP